MFSCVHQVLLTSFSVMQITNCLSLQENLDSQKRYLNLVELVQNIQAISDIMHAWYYSIFNLKMTALPNDYSFSSNCMFLLNSLSDFIGPHLWT